MHSQNTSIILPPPRCGAISIRTATLEDLPFLDGLQKQTTHQVGYFPTKQWEGYLKMKAVLMAEQRDETKEKRGETAAESGETKEKRDEKSDSKTLVSDHSSLSTPLGYIIFRDSYSGRDDVGIIYQLNVAPSRQRKLVGAALVREAFARSAYGVRLFSCWCAQDIQANWFWEAIGFVPLAFRTGSRGRQRTHIFWQKRIREGDQATPWWYPSQTRGGGVREDRVVFPIPPGVHWRDAKPVILPEARDEEAQVALAACPRVSGSNGARTGRQAASGTAGAQPARSTQARKVAIVRSGSKALRGLPPGKAAVITGGGIRYVDRADYVPEPEPVPQKKPKRPRKPAAKMDPKFLAAARELRDRYLEQVNRDGSLLLPAGKYDVAVARALPDYSATAGGVGGGGEIADACIVVAEVVPAPMKALPEAA